MRISIAHSVVSAPISSGRAASRCSASTASPSSQCEGRRRRYSARCTRREGRPGRGGSRAGAGGGRSPRSAPRASRRHRPGWWRVAAQDDAAPRMFAAHHAGHQGRGDRGRTSLCVADPRRRRQGRQAGCHARGGLDQPRAVACPTCWRRSRRPRSRRGPWWWRACSTSFAAVADGPAIALTPNGAPKVCCQTSPHPWCWRRNSTPGRASGLIGGGCRHGRGAKT